jgi:hypothetical protein
LLGASGLGAFEDPPPTADTYVARAQKALAAGAFVTPPSENVRDITDSALRRWPGQPKLLALRGAAARSLIDRASALGVSSRPQALELLRFAEELDPSNSDSRRLQNELSDAEAASANVTGSALAAPPSARRTNSKSAPNTSAAPGRSATPAASAPAPPPAGSGQVAHPEADAPAGRWL